MKNVLITGGCGFIGTNTAKYHLKRGDDVYIMDNLSRRGAAFNLEYLRSLGTVNFFNVDIRDRDGVLSVFKKHDFDAVYHLGAQVAVTTSVTDPRTDFEVNALGTFNVLEGMRQAGSGAPFLYSSTNKVYGGLEGLNVVLKGDRYEYERIEGVGEGCQLDFHSPYGCSKGAADQYVRDYSRIYGLKTVVFRQSCIYGYHQFGVEDQGWVAWFTIASIFNKKLTIYGDGRQVRDVLFIDDLVKAYVRAMEYIGTTGGQVYNIGGGKFNMSLLELIGHLEKLLKKPIETGYADWRPGDQKVFICDISKAKRDFGWSPEVSPEEGVRKLYELSLDNKQAFRAAGIM